MPLAEFSLLSTTNLLNPYPGTASHVLIFLCQFLTVNQGDPELLGSSRPFKMGSCFADLSPCYCSVLRIPRQARWPQQHCSLRPSVLSGRGKIASHEFDFWFQRQKQPPHPQSKLAMAVLEGDLRFF